MCALLFEAFLKVSTPIVDVQEGDPAALLRTGNRLRIDGTAWIVEGLSQGDRATRRGKSGGLMATREELLDQAGGLAHHNEMTYLG